MDDEKYNRSVRLICSTCAATDFEYDKEQQDGPVRCISCGRTFNREELISENHNIIYSQLDELKEDFLKDAQTELRDSLRP